MEWIVVTSFGCTELLVRGATSKRKAMTWYLAGVGACVYGVVWNIVTWSGVNLRFSFLDESIHHATRIINVILLVVGIAQLYVMMSLAVGLTPTAIVRIGSSGEVEVARAPWLPGVRPKTNLLASPVLIEYRFIKGDRRMVSRWDLWFVGSQSKLRVGTIWPLRDDDIQALREALTST